MVPTSVENDHCVSGLRKQIFTTERAVFSYVGIFYLGLNVNPNAGALKFLINLFILKARVQVG